MSKAQVALYLRLLSEQRAWIEKCESGLSYLGPNGKAIKDADYQELRRIEEKLKERR